MSEEERQTRWFVITKGKQVIKVTHDKTTAILEAYHLKEKANWRYYYVIREFDYKYKRWHNVIEVSDRLFKKNEEGRIIGLKEGL